MTTTLKTLEAYVAKFGRTRKWKGDRISLELLRSLLEVAKAAKRPDDAGPFDWSSKLDASISALDAIAARLEEAKK